MLTKLEARRILNQTLSDHVSERFRLIILIYNTYYRRKGQEYDGQNYCRWSRCAPLPRSCHTQEDSLACERTGRYNPAKYWLLSHWSQFLIPLPHSNYLWGKSQTAKNHDAICEKDHNNQQHNSWQNIWCMTCWYHSAVLKWAVHLLTVIFSLKYTRV